jgi:hypothetical protein
MSKAQPGTVTDLTAFYDLGATSLREHPTLPRRSYAHLPEDEQRKIKSDAERLLKARTFADPEKGYSLAEFHRLIERCEAGGFVLGTSLVIKLLGVPKGKARNALQAAAIKGRWTWSQLSDAIRASGKTRKSHATQGRTVAGPETTADALSMLYSDCVAFRKRAAAIMEAADGVGLMVVVQVGIEEAAKEMMRLEKKVGKYLDYSETDSK